MSPRVKSDFYSDVKSILNGETARDTAFWSSPIPAAPARVTIRLGDENSSGNISRPVSCLVAASRASNSHPFPDPGSVRSFCFWS